MFFSKLQWDFPHPLSDAPSEWMAYRALLQDLRAITNIFPVGFDSLLPYEIDAYLAAHPYPHMGSDIAPSSTTYAE